MNNDDIVAMCITCGHTDELRYVGGCCVKCGHPDIVYRRVGAEAVGPIRRRIERIVELRGKLERRATEGGS